MSATGNLDWVVPLLVTARVAGGPPMRVCPPAAWDMIRAYAAVVQAHGIVTRRALAGDERSKAILLHLCGWNAP